MVIFILPPYQKHLRSTSTVSASSLLRAFASKNTLRVAFYILLQLLIFLLLSDFSHSERDVSPLSSHLETVPGGQETAVALRLRVPLDPAMLRATLACFVLSARGGAFCSRYERKEQAHAI